jgi:PPM family protein phosphatase
VNTVRIPAIEIAVRTDPGRDPDKHVNEDAAIHAETPLGVLAVVCDGMGGHAGGKEASELAVKTIESIVSAAPSGSVAKTVLRHAIEEANARIWTMPTAEAGLRPGSTVVAMLLSPEGADIAHVGDSRIYLVHKGAIAQVTRDHSMVQEMVDRNLIKAEDAAKHPDANKILRALGIAKDVDVDVRIETLPYVAGDVFILCSDGLSDLVGPAEILEIAGSHPPKQAAGQLVDLANARGGHDNITAMVIRMKVSSEARDPTTLVKTMQLTASEMPLNVAPADRGSGPTGTVVSPPGFGPAQGPGTAVTPPTLPTPHAPAGVVMPPSTSAQVVDAPSPAPAAMGGPAAIPTPPPRASIPPRSRIGVFLGVALALVALALIGGLIFVSTRPQHHDVRVIDDEPKKDAAIALNDDDASTEPNLVPTPPLAGVHDGGHHDGGHHRRHDGGPRPTPSGAATPSPTPSPSPTPAPTLPPPGNTR